MKKFINIILFLLMLLPAMGQNVRDIRRRMQAIEGDKEYLSAHGTGKDETEANAQALTALLNRISVNVEHEYKQEDIELREGNQVKSDSRVKSVIHTYSHAKLNDVHYLVIPQKNEFSSLCYIRKSEVEKIFTERAERVAEYVRQGLRAEEQLKIDDALTFYYWGFCLLKTMPNPNQWKQEVEGSEEALNRWIPRRINHVLGRIQSKVANWTGNEANLYMTYGDKPVTSLEFQIWNGVEYGKVYKATGGRAHVYLHGGINPKQGIQIAYSYERKGEAKTCDEEVSDVLNTLENPFKNQRMVEAGEMDDDLANNTDTIVIGSGKEQKEVQRLYQQAEQSACEAVTAMQIKNVKELNKAVTAVIGAIQRKNYISVKEFFTEQGYLMFDTLIHYGQARIIGTPKWSFYHANERVVCRSIPMSFSFPNSKKVFNEDVTLTFNGEGKIESVAFALNQMARNDIFQKAWPDSAKMVVATFLENYQTAFALKRLDYIEQLFHDNAIIITGSVLKKAPQTIENQKVLDLPSVKYTEHNKQQYIENLRKCFSRNEYVHLRFTDNDFRSTNDSERGELYGLQIHQNYASSTYSDDGYLFLMVDFNDAEKPVIILRTWQPRRDPGIYSKAETALKYKDSPNYGLYHMGNALMR